MSQDVLGRCTLRIWILVAVQLIAGCRTESGQNSTSFFQLQSIDAKLDSVEGCRQITGPSVLSDPDRFVWGASVAKGDDGRYHMLYATWPSGSEIPPFSTSWLTHSQIAYAVSDYPDRDFSFVKIVLKGRKDEGDPLAWDAQMVHNPHLRKFGSKYYLYYIGSRDPVDDPNYSERGTVNARNRIQQVQKIGVIEFRDFEELLNGSFERPDRPLLEPRTRVKANDIVMPDPDDVIPKPDNIIVVNPSVVFRPSDKKYLLYFKGNIYDPGWRGVHGVAIADTPIGPFEPLDEFVLDITTEDGSVVNAEDPYVWYAKGDETFYAIIKDFSGKLTKSQPGLAVIRSFDGIKWTYPEKPVSIEKAITLSEDVKVRVSNLERPQLLFDDSGDPQVLFAACAIDPVGKSQMGNTFNVHIPVRAVD